MFNIDASDAHAFVTRLNAKEKTTKHRLPTEAEWEYAAKGGAWGDREAIDHPPASCAWTYAQGAAVLPVDMARPGAFSRCAREAGQVIVDTGARGSAEAPYAHSITPLMSALRSVPLSLAVADTRVPSEPWLAQRELEHAHPPRHTREHGPTV